MCFYHILHKNTIGHLLRISRDPFRPPSFIKEMDNILLYLYVHFRGVFVVYPKKNLTHPKAAKLATLTYMKM